MEGDIYLIENDKFRIISIHSLRMEGDNKRPKIVTNFCISIHSLRMEGDFWCTERQPSTSHFNPLPPHGGRHVGDDIGDDFISFQSTPSAWRETKVHTGIWLMQWISIHSLRMEGDLP